MTREATPQRVMRMNFIPRPYLTIFDPQSKLATDAAYLCYDYNT